MNEVKKPREFIAFKRAEKSPWIYEEYSEEADKAIDAIAPEGGNFEKLRLIEKSAYDKAIEALKEAKLYVAMIRGSIEGTKSVDSDGNVFHSNPRRDAIDLINKTLNELGELM